MPFLKPNKTISLLLKSSTAIAVGITILGISLTLLAEPKNPHDFLSVGCTHCHITVPGRSNIITKRIFRRDISELCLQCHEDSTENQINHRIGILPSMKVPDDLHLGSRGELTCITCHMPHLPYINKRTGGRTYFLRRGLLKRELCLACHYEETFEEPTADFRIIAPIDNSIVKYSPVPFIGTVSSANIHEVTLFINGIPLRLTVKNSTFSTMLSLQDNVNNLTLKAKKAKDANMTIIYSPDMSEDLKYKLYSSHGITKKSDCKFCHTDESSNTVKVPDQVLCSKCHEEKNKLKHLHGPVAVGSCTVCHDPHGQTNRYYLVQEAENLCFNCHSEKEVLFHFLEKSAPGIKMLKSKGCGYCHDPHQSEKKYLLRKV